jgi:6-phosphogluconolactonase
VTRLTTCADPESVAERAAAEITRLVRAARGERHLARVALSGGSTPRRTYELLAQSGELDRGEGLELWFADERCVGPSDPESNYRLVAETLLGPAGIGERQVQRMEGELGPERGARHYARELAARVPGLPGANGAAGPPVLDLVVLGIGPDGHVASLFPDSGALDAPADALCIGVHDSPKPPPERITLSMPVLRAARRCLLIAEGSEKADAVRAMLGEPTPGVPASLLARERLTVIVDDAAAPSGAAGR